MSKWLSNQVNHRRSAEGSSGISEPGISAQDDTQVDTAARIAVNPDIGAERTTPAVFLLTITITIIPSASPTHSVLTTSPAEPSC